MAVTRKDVEFAKVIAYDRWRDAYAYGGTWSPFIRSQGGDCSGTVIDECDAVRNGTAMAWTRHAMSTESWRPPAMGGSADPANGPFGSVMVNHPDQFPPDAAVLIALHHGVGGGANSHMWCQVDNLKIETNGSDGTVLNDGARYLDKTLDCRNTSYANNWWYIAGPITEDGTPRVTGPSNPATPTPDKPAVDTLFADVSEWQVNPIDDTYPYKTVSIRSNDGTYQDKLWAPNHAWCRQAVDAGRLALFLVYFVWRPGVDNVGVLQRMVGDPHPKMAVEIDIESWGGQITGDQSAGINADHDRIATWLGNPARVGGYGNTSDLNTLWRTKPDGIAIRLASYGSNPDYPGKVAHQYTNGQGYGDGLPEGAPPWSTCDMNSADGLDPSALASAYGITTAATPTPVPSPPIPVHNPPAIPKPPDVATQVSQIWDQLLLRWDVLGNNTAVETLGALQSEQTKGLAHGRRSNRSGRQTGRARPQSA